MLRGVNLIDIHSGDVTENVNIVIAGDRIQSIGTDQPSTCPGGAGGAAGREDDPGDRGQAQSASEPRGNRIDTLSSLACDGSTGLSFVHDTEIIYR